MVDDPAFQDDMQLDGREQGCWRGIAFVCPPATPDGFHRGLGGTDDVVLCASPAIFIFVGCCGSSISYLEEWRLSLAPARLVARFVVR